MQFARNPVQRRHHHIADLDLRIGQYLRHIIDWPGRDAPRMQFIQPIGHILAAQRCLENLLQRIGVPVTLRPVMKAGIVRQFRQAQNLQREME